MEFSDGFLRECHERPKIAKLPETFPIVDKPISYEEFYRDFLLPNLPCLIKGQDLMKSWKSRLDWRSDEDQPDLGTLANIVPGDLDVPVSNCDKKYFNSQDCCEQKFRDYLEYWAGIGQGQRPEDHPQGSMYLKDWHFHRDCPHYQVCFISKVP